MIQNNLIHEGERLDELQRNGYGIIQNPARFCFGMDAVLLSGFAKAKAGEKVLDLGPAPELFDFNGSKDGRKQILQR